MTTQNGRAFNEWLRAQLKAKKMSQRQLAQQSGVDHSTISRLIRGDRMPSLGTATKLARGLRELRDDADTPQYLGVVAAGASNPTARVEYALRADDLLNEAQVRQIMEYYLAVRMRRFGRTYQPPESSDRTPEGGSTHGQGGGRGPVTHGQGASGTNGGTAITPRYGTASAMTGTIRPMATVRPLTTVRPTNGSALPSAPARPIGHAPRPMSQPPRALGRPGRETGRY